MSGVAYEAGTVLTIEYPFIRDTYEEWGEDGPSIIKTWRPGVRYEADGPDSEVAVADAIGRAHFAVVSVHKPGRFPVRVFYTRQWEDPSGRRFGKGGCRVATLDAFRRRTAGYQHRFVVVSSPLPTDDGRA